MLSELENTEAVVLTGGASRRMGRDKAELAIDGIAMAGRIVSEFTTRSIQTTVLGPKPIEGANHIGDEVAFQGPLVTLSQFQPELPFCFVTSCDIPGFDGAIVSLLRKHADLVDAVIPSIHGRLQPLCALYSACAWHPLRRLAVHGESRLMRWVDSLRIKVLEEEALVAAGIDVDSCTNVNTREELDGFLQRRYACR